MAELALNWKLHAKQKFAYQSLATEILFGGATRGGKSHFARVVLCTLCLKIAQLQCILIRKKSQDILDNHVYGKNGFKDLLRDLEAAGLARVTQDGVSFDNGSRITFRHCQDERQFDSAQGISSNVLVIDEATQISERLLRTFRGWCTMSEEMKASLPDEFKGKLPLILYTANPIGVSIGYFRRNFVKPVPACEIREVGGFRRQYIPSKVEDNPSEDKKATEGRMSEMYDAATAQALLEGDWDAPVGEFFTEWNEDRHVVPDFIPPDHWFKWRSLDWGGRDPAAVYWLTTSDGESFMDHRGRLRWFPRGAKIAYREWYICDEDDPARGIKMRNEDMATGILARSNDNEKRVVTLADSIPFAELGGPCIAEVFGDNGCPLTKGDTSRIAGWSTMRSGLIGVEIDPSKPRVPMLYVVESCKFLRDYIPSLPRHPLEGKRNEDAAEDGEATHSCDAIRVGIHSRPLVTSAPAPVPKTENLKNNWTFDNALKMIQDGRQDNGW